VGSWAQRPGEISGMRSDKLRIAFATPEYVTEKYFDGGLANYVNRVAKLLVNLRHEVHVVTHSQIDEAEFEHEGVKVHRVRPRRVWAVCNRATRYTLANTLHWLSLSTQIYRKLRQLHRETPFHLIQYPNYSSCGLFAIPFLRATHIVRVSSYQPDLNGVSGRNRSVDSSLSEGLETLQYKLTRNVFVPSHTMRSILAKKAALPDVPVIRSPFFVETDDWDTAVYDRFLKSKQYLLYFGRFQIHKGFHILAQALPRFLEQNPDAHVALVGRDMETNLAHSMAGFARMQSGPYSARLVFLENLPHKQLYPVINGARLVVLPSLFDNSPNACLEAMGLGKVVIGTEGASFDELITDGVNGFLVPRNDVEALADKMISAWVNPDLQGMSDAARQRMLEFAPEKTINSLLNYYSNALNGSVAK
jgi:glycosyltransferase involved in cell wall biosynthesis